MKTVAAIRGYLLDRQANAMRRPAMYHASPESMEDCFFLLDDLLASIGDNEPGSYTDFLVEHGFQAARFTDQPADGKGVSERFDELVRFLAAYMATAANFRPVAQPDMEAPGDA